jgi:hypothetical protein
MILVINVGSREATAGFGHRGSPTQTLVLADFIPAALEAVKFASTFDGRNSAKPVGVARLIKPRERGWRLVLTALLMFWWS